jgi:hypothetical protein
MPPACHRLTIARLTAGWEKEYTEESAESWKAVLRELKRRGMAAPVLAVGDGALGFWAAAREVWPETREQGCWCHKLSNFLDKLPQRLHSRAKRALHEMMYTVQRSDCDAARADEFQVKYPKAVESLIANWERLVVSSSFQPSIGNICVLLTCRSKGLVGQYIKVLGRKGNEDDDNGTEGNSGQGWIAGNWPNSSAMFRRRAG